MHTITETKHKTYISCEKNKRLCKSLIRSLSWELKDIDELYKSNILKKNLDKFYF